MTKKSLAHTTLVSCLIAGILMGAKGQSPMNGGTASVTGRVTIDGRPLSGISVTLRRTDEDSAAEPLRSPIRASTDSDGRYLFSGIPSGRYAVAPFTPGFIFRNDPLNAGAKVVTVESGDLVTGLDFALAKGGVITGRITYADERPVIGEQPHLMRFDERNGQPAYFSPRARRSATTDDRGVYRFYGLPAGPTP